jgi:uncharacterized protein YutE (UPF0331/DUF86 family)
MPLPQRRINLILDDLPRRLEALHYELERTPQAEFEAAFSSDDPAELSRAHSLERAFEVVVNHVGGLVVEGLILAGKRRRREGPHLPRDLERLRDEGGVSAAQCERLIRYVSARNRLQHQYPDLDSSGIYEGARGVAAELPSFFGGYRRWLGTMR